MLAFTLIFDRGCIIFHTNCLLKIIFCFSSLFVAIISYARTRIKNPVRGQYLPSFETNVPVRVYSKSAGSNPDYWGIEIDGERGYINKRHLIEERILSKSDLVTHVVPTELAMDTEDKTAVGTDEMIDESVAKGNESLTPLVRAIVQESKIESNNTAIEENENVAGNDLNPKIVVAATPSPTIIDELLPAEIPANVERPIGVDDAVQNDTVIDDKFMPEAIPSAIVDNVPLQTASKIADANILVNLLDDTKSNETTAAAESVQPREFNNNTTTNVPTKDAAETITPLADGIKPVEEPPFIKLEAYVTTNDTAPENKHKEFDAVQAQPAVPAEKAPVVMPNIVESMRKSKMLASNLKPPESKNETKPAAKREEKPKDVRPTWVDVSRVAETPTKHELTESKYFRNAKPPKLTPARFISSDSDLDDDDDDDYDDEDDYGMPKRRKRTKRQPATQPQKRSPPPTPIDDVKLELIAPNINDMPTTPLPNMQADLSAQHPIVNKTVSEQQTVETMRANTNELTNDAVKTAPNDVLIETDVAQKKLETNDAQPILNQKDVPIENVGAQSVLDGEQTKLAHDRIVNEKAPANGNDESVAQQIVNPIDVTTENSGRQPVLDGEQINVAQDRMENENVAVIGNDESVRPAQVLSPGNPNNVINENNAAVPVEQNQDASEMPTEAVSQQIPVVTLQQQLPNAVPESLNIQEQRPPTPEVKQETPKLRSEPHAVHYENSQPEQLAGTPELNVNVNQQLATMETKTENPIEKEPHKAEDTIGAQQIVNNKLDDFVPPQQTPEIIKENVEIEKPVPAAPIKSETVPHQAENDKQTQDAQILPKKSTDGIEDNQPEEPRFEYLKADRSEELPNDNIATPPQAPLEQQPAKSAQVVVHDETTQNIADHPLHNNAIEDEPPVEYLPVDNPKANGNPSQTDQTAKSAPAASHPASAQILADQPVHNTEIVDKHTEGASEYLKADRPETAQHEPIAMAEPAIQPRQSQAAAQQTSRLPTVPEVPGPDAVETTAQSVQKPATIGHEQMVPDEHDHLPETAQQVPIAISEPAVQPLQSEPAGQQTSQLPTVPEVSGPDAVETPAQLVQKPATIVHEQMVPKEHDRSHEESHGHRAQKPIFQENTDPRPAPSSPSPEPMESHSHTELIDEPKVVAVVVDEVQIASPLDDTVQPLGDAVIVDEIVEPTENTEDGWLTIITGWFSFGSANTNNMVPLSDDAEIPIEEILYGKVKDSVKNGHNAAATIGE